jgi:hypothetical protein
MFLIGSLATYISMGSYYNYLYKRAKVLEAQNKAIKDEIFELADEVDARARIQAINIIFSTQRVIFNELMKSIPDDKIDELKETLNKKEEEKLNVSRQHETEGTD